MRKVLFAILPLLSFAVCVKADTLTFQAGELIVPNQATAIWVTVQPPGVTLTDFYIANFVFPDGTGLERGDFNDGDNGFISFTVPVTNLSVTFLAMDNPYGISDSLGQDVECNLPVFPAFCPEISTIHFSGTGITSVSWFNADGFSGIESMSYTLAVPEPRALWLLLTGLLLLGLSRWAQMSLRKLSGHCK